MLKLQRYVLPAVLGMFLGFFAVPALHADCVDVRCSVWCHNAGGDVIGYASCHAEGDGCECFTNLENNGYAYCNAHCEVDSELTWCSILE